MSLYGALFAGVSGLNAQSQSIGIISDNIANVNTVGYKTNSTKFSTLITSSTAGSHSPGGVRSLPSQQVNVQGVLQGTANATDLGISGSGFFVANTSATGIAGSEYLFTRAGSFSPDEAGNLVNSAGLYLQGWATDINGVPTATNLDVLDQLQTVNVTGLNGNATPTSQIVNAANLPATAAVGSTNTQTIQVFDSLGVAHNVDFTWTKTATNTWSLDVSDARLAADNTTVTATTQVTARSITFNGDGTPSSITAPALVIGSTIATTADAGAALANIQAAGATQPQIDDVTISGAVDNGDVHSVTIAGTTVSYTVKTGDTTVNDIRDGLIAAINANTTVAALVTASANGAGVVRITADANNNPLTNTAAATDKTHVAWTTGSNASTVALNLGTVNKNDGMTQLADTFSVNQVQQNGVQFGLFTGVSIDSEGIVEALFDNGEQVAIFKVPLVTFANPNGLQPRTGNSYVQSANSGPFILRSAATGGAGRIAAATLEGSTVDIGSEFTNMIITQRAYSASAQIISTADEMLEELIAINR